MSGLRVFLVGLRFHVKALTHSVFFLLTSVFMPMLVATVAYYMYKAGNQPGSLLYVSLGAAVYGIWSSTLFGSGGRSSGSAGRGRSRCSSRRRPPSSSSSRR
jgi:ABC-2 type transport system permease protein